MAFVKRVLVGRPLATTQMEEQRLSKTIALAVFSSDALSSTAYATEEILFVTAVGASSLALGLSKLVPIAIVVARPARDRDRLVPAGDLRLPERRRRVRREQGEHRRDRVARRGRVADGRLRAHRRGVDLGRASPRSSRSPRSAGSRDQRVELGVVLIVLITLLNMRGVKESGRIFAIPTYVYMLRPRRAHRLRARRSSFFGDISRCRSTRSAFDGQPRERRHARHLPAAEGLLVGRGRAHRRRGDLERRARVPAARSRRTRPRRSCGWACCSARCSSASRCSRTASSRTRATTAR